jgi:hypothetical protein
LLSRESLGPELVVVVKIRLWWDQDFGPHASHPNFQPPVLRVLIVLLCRPVMSADIKNKNSFLVSTDLISQYKKYVLFKSLFFILAIIIGAYQK